MDLLPGSAPGLGDESYVNSDFLDAESKNSESDMSDLVHDRRNLSNFGLEGSSSALDPCVPGSMPAASVVLDKKKRKASKKKKRPQKIPAHVREIRDVFA